MERYIDIFCWSILLIALSYFVTGMVWHKWVMP